MLTSSFASPLLPSHPQRCLAGRTRRLAADEQRKWRKCPDTPFNSTRATCPRLRMESSSHCWKTRWSCRCITKVKPGGVGAVLATSVLRVGAGVWSLQKGPDLCSLVLISTEGVYSVVGSDLSGIDYRWLRFIWTSPEKHPTKSFHQIRTSLCWDQDDREI